MDKRLRFLFLCAGISVLLTFLSSCSSGSSKLNESKDVSEAASPYQDAVDDSLLVEFETAHNALTVAIIMYAATNGDENPREIDDLKLYVDGFDNLITKPKGATYDLSVDSDNHLTLTSTYGDNELIFEN